MLEAWIVYSTKPLRDVTTKISRQVHDLQDLVNLEESLKRARI